MKKRNLSNLLADYFIPGMILLWLIIMSGCSTSNPQRELIQELRTQNANQHRQTENFVELQKDVSQSTKELVAADANARLTWADVQKELEHSRSNLINQQGEIHNALTSLESERKAIANERKWDLLSASVLKSIGGLLAVAIPLLLLLPILFRSKEDLTQEESVDFVLRQATDRSTHLSQVSHDSVPLLNDHTSQRGQRSSRQENEASL